MEIEFKKKPILLGTPRLWCCTITRILQKKDIYLLVVLIFSYQICLNESLGNFGHKTIMRLIDVKWDSLKRGRLKRFDPPILQILPCFPWWFKPIVGYCCDGMETIIYTRDCIIGDVEWSRRMYWIYCYSNVVV